MILGILSDTHGQQLRTAKALRLLQHLGAQALVHCGDIGGHAVLGELIGMPGWVVPGNTDLPDAALERYAESLGLTLARDVPLRIRLNGCAVAVFHGHEPAFEELVEEVAETGALPDGFGPCDYVFHGHTHVASDHRLGPVRIINPGALHRAGTYTVATLDLQSDDLRFWHVLDDSEITAPVRFQPA